VLEWFGGCCGLLWGRVAWLGCFLLRGLGVCAFGAFLAFWGFGGGGVWFLDVRNPRLIFGAFLPVSAPPLSGSRIEIGLGLAFSPVEGSVHRPPFTDWRGGILYPREVSRLYLFLLLSLGRVGFFAFPGNLFHLGFSPSQVLTPCSPPFRSADRTSSFLVHRVKTF